MAITDTSHRWLGKWTRDTARALQRWSDIVHFAALALVLVLTPSTYARGNRPLIAQQIYASTWRVLLWFTVLCSLISLVLIRIVVVTALSYGLSQYALEMVVRVLVLELIPLGAALFVVLRSGASSAALHGAVAPVKPAVALQKMRREWVPRMIAGAFSVLLLAGVSGVVALVLAYLTVYGFSPWGLPEYTRVVGRVFAPVVVLAFVLKTVLFAVAVAVIPLASALQAAPAMGPGDGSVSQGTVRLFLVLVLIEAASLSIKYI
jgi:phospholipid/cholesterol/gamma-HCH transport system permease protein